MGRLERGGVLGKCSGEWSRGEFIIFGFRAWISPKVWGMLDCLRFEACAVSIEHGEIGVRVLRF